MSARWSTTGSATVAMVLLWSGWAAAQGTSVRSLGGAPADKGTGTRGESSPGAEGASSPGGLYGMDTGGAAASSADETISSDPSVPEMHTVKKGDTLWGLCQGYFQDPWRWPRLWAENPLITNPHWIFPGDVVRLQSGPSGSGAAALPAALGPAPPVAASEFGGGLKRSALASPTGVALREIGFVDPRQLADGARITGSREEKIMLSTGDQAYITAAADRPLRAGERYTIYVADQDHPVRRPDTGEILGYIVRVYGDVLVDQITESGMARGTLVDLTGPVERGFLVGPLYRQFRNLEPQAASASGETRIVDALQPNKLLGYQMFVVVDRGKAAGVEPGNRLFVIRRGDGYSRLLETLPAFDPSYPKEVVGELVVVDVRENLAVAWVLRSSKEMRVGDVAEMRRGY